MTAPRYADVLVVGAGPAGAVTAAALARSGVRVLLAGDQASPAAHDVMVSAPATRGLAGLGMDVIALVSPIDAIDLRFGGSAGRVLTGAGAAVCDLTVLREGLRRHAVAAGAGQILGAVTSLTGRDGARQAMIDGRPVVARHVVIATGSASSALYGRGALTSDSPEHATGLACAQRCANAGLGPRMLLAMTAPTGPGEQPTCVWALPGPDGSMTLGGAVVGAHGSADPARLLGSALHAVADSGLCHAALRPSGPVISGPLNTGFTPGRVADADCLLVGAAAGLVNPFTGEGLSGAVQSGLLAAEAIAANLADPGAARRAYAGQLAATFVGHFETARHAARRYHLTWRVLAASAGSDHPFFAKVRQAVLMPDGLGGLTGTGTVDLASPDAPVLGPFLVACDEVAITTIRREWPFLAHLAMAGGGLEHRQLRPAVLFFAALLAGGKAPDIKRATIGAAIELATLGALAFLGPALPPAPRGASLGGHPPNAPRRGVDWATTATVLAGDFLLAHASRLVAESAPEISWSFADWLAELTALRAGRLDPAGDVPAGAVFASLFEFPCRIGAMLGGGSPEVVRALRGIGYHCGHAYLHAEDVLAMRGQRTRLDTTLHAMIQGRISAIPEFLAGQRVSGENLAADPRIRSIALAAAMTAGRDARQRAMDTIVTVPSPAAARILRQFVSAVAAPVLTQGRTG